MAIYLVRHGETEPNRRGLALGRRDVPLAEHGVWQAGRLAVALSGERLAAVYSSPLQRCLDTARAVASCHGLEVRVEERLIEMDIGDLEGLTFAEISSRFPGLLERWAGGPGPSVVMPGGERLLDVQERAWALVEELRERHREEQVVAVTHNFVILSLLARVLGIDLSQFRRLRHSLAAISMVQFDARGLTVERLNDTCHLVEG